MAIGVGSLYMMDTQLNTFNWSVFLGAAIGSFMPDCDHKHALAGTWIPLHKLTKHRQHTHSLYMGIVFSTLVGVFNIRMAAGLLFGYIMHLVGDRTTYYGCRHGLTHIFWPYKVNERIIK